MVYGRLFSSLRSWVAGNEVIVKNVNANIPVSLLWFLLPFLAFLCCSASAQSIDSSLQSPNSVFLQMRGCPRLQKPMLGFDHYISTYLL